MTPQSLRALNRAVAAAAGAVGRFLAWLYRLP